MEVLLDNLLKELHRVNPSLAALLQPGIDRAVVDKVLEEFGLIMPGEIYDLYLWRNGVGEPGDENSDLMMLPMGSFYPLEEMARIQSGEGGRFWPKNLFPIFASGGGDEILVNCEKGATFGRFYYFSPSDYRWQGVISKFDSLSTLIQSVTECYEKGAYYLDEENFLMFDTWKEKEICQRLNPLSDFWKLDM